jgi:voltage-gated potassium channel Kch
MVTFFTILLRFVCTVGRSWKDPEFRELFFLVFVMLASGTLFYSQVEGWSTLDSLFFSVVTLTTVGYGHITPRTAAGKIFTILYIFVGIGIILGFVNAVAERSIEQRKEKARSRGQDPEA